MTSTPNRCTTPWRAPAAGLRLAVACATASIALATGPAGADAPSPPLDCAQAATQAELNACAHEAFLAAQADLSAALRRARSGLPAEARSGLRRVQRTWTAYRTEACGFESRHLAGGSARPLVRWQCATRLTRERITALERAAHCEEGDLACALPRR